MLPIAATLVVVLNALLMIPTLAEQRPTIATAALLVAALTAVIAWLPAGKPRPAAESAAEPATPAMPPAPEAPAMNASGQQAETRVVTLLGAFQEQGRLVDFLMEDVTPYDDAQIGASARVVHQGCRAVLNEYFDVHPVSEAGEGSAVTVPVGYAADEYRLVGKVSGSGPYNGTLVHPGWKTTSVKLPNHLESTKDRLPTIAPAEVEVSG